MAVNKVVYGNTVVIDISSTTATASDVTLGERFYLADGQAAIGTHQEDPLEVHGGASVDGTTLILDESEGSTAAISVVDTPDTHGGTIRTITALDISGTTAVASDVAQGKYFYTAGGVKTAGTASGGGGTSATQHTIHLEFSDTTDTDIDVYYDDPLISTMITNYVPETYGVKTVDVAELDGVTWYTRPTEIWETLYNDDVAYYPDQDNVYPYCWIEDLGNVPMPVSSVWRVTFGQTEYRCVAFYDTTLGENMIGNPLYSGGQDNGSGAPFSLYYTVWGAWSGSANVNENSIVHIKIERLVT